MEEQTREGRPSLEDLFRLMRPSLEELPSERYPSLEELLYLSKTMLLVYLAQHVVATWRRESVLGPCGPIAMSALTGDRIRDFVFLISLVQNFI